MRPAGFLLTRQKSEVYTVRVGVFEFARKKPVLCPDIPFSPRNSEMNGVRKNTKCEGIIIATPLPTVISSNFVSCIRCWGRSRRNHLLLTRHYHKTIGINNHRLQTTSKSSHEESSSVSSPNITVDFVRNFRYVNQ